MERTGRQSVEEKKISMVALAVIQPSGYNPRKHFDEASLVELADSIRQQGVLQPIGVRPINEIGKFEIVFGERRYRASLMADMTEIPATILNVSDEVAEEMAVTENLQRKDVTPIEEANAYQKLIDSGRHDIKSLAVQFGKNETYIRTRLKFTALIPEIAELLEKDELTISVASEICRYGEDIQREVFDKHLKEGVMYGSWRGMKATEVAKNIERDFTTDLGRYNFDKALCLSCPHNTNNMTLFCEGSCGNCAKRSCLAEMNTAFIVEKSIQALSAHPLLSLGYNQYCYDMGAVNRLKELGYEVTELTGRCYQYPELPEEPQSGNYETEDAFREAKLEYDQKVNDYMEECKELVRRNEEGEISLYAQIGQKDISMCYVEVATRSLISGQTAELEQLSPILKLEKQDKRNKEIAREKTVDDIKKRIFEVDVTETKFGTDEDRMMYYFMLSSLRKEHFSVVGIEEEHSPYLTGEEKMNIIANLTSKIKAVIRRDYLIANFKSDAYGNNVVADLLLAFAQKHMPEALAEIKNTHDEVYQKRHQRIEEKKAVLQVQEQAKQETDQFESDTTEQEPQSQEVAA